MTFAVRPLSAVSAAQLDDLAEVLADCVDGGASVSFMPPFGADQARAFWQQVAAGVATGERALLVAQDTAGRIVGTVQLVLDQPPNQPHRADLAKMLVHRRARRAQHVEPRAVADRDDAPHLHLAAGDERGRGAVLEAHKRCHLILDGDLRFQGRAPALLLQGVFLLF